MRLGYARVSRADQHTEQQETALRDAGCEKLFIDHGVSGAAEHRPQLERLLDQLRSGDVVVVAKLDRLGRSLPNVLDIVEEIERQGAGLVSLAESAIDTTSAAGKLVFRIFAVVAEFERDRLRERTVVGLVRARANGAQLGRPQRLDTEEIEDLLALRKEGRSYASLAKTFRISRSTARKYCITVDKLQST